MTRSFIGILLMLLLTATGIHAQESASQKATIHAGFGTVTMGDVQWQRFSFRPDVPIGKFGIGLDVELFIDENGKIAKEGWDFSTANKTWDTVLRKIYYLRYGRPLDRVYVRAGALDNVTLGYGLIMDGYRNTLNYPGDKKVGLDFGFRDIGTFGFELQGMVNSFGDLRNKGAVVATRFALRPLKPMNLGILSKLTIGATLARDINQYAGLADSDEDGVPDFQDGFPDDGNKWEDSDGDGFEDPIDIDLDGDNRLDADENLVDIARQDYLNIEERKDGISAYGFDVGLPLYEGSFHLDLYGQYSKMHTGLADKEGGWGVGAPGLRLIIQRFSGQVEYRHFEGRYRPNYFDNLYEHERVTLVGSEFITKEMSLELVEKTLNGVYGYAGYNFFDMVTARGSYQFMKGKSNDYQDVTGKVVISEQLLKQVPKISIAEAYYYNTYITEPYDIFDHTEKTLYGTRIGFEVAPSLLIVWDTRYTFTPKGDGSFERNRFVGIETVMKMR
ncbi:hypothetical protein ACFL47_04210 [Candidatus Latescibacterota bacterium]